MSTQANRENIPSLNFKVASSESRKDHQHNTFGTAVSDQILSPGGHPVDLDLSKQGMQMLDKMSNDEQATFLEFQRRLQESNHVSTASSFIVANELSQRENNASSFINPMCAGHQDSLMLYPDSHAQAL